jgi:hypothetical protein
MFSNSKLLNRAQKLMGILFTIMGLLRVCWAFVHQAKLVLAMQ